MALDHPGTDRYGFFGLFSFYGRHDLIFDNALRNIPVGAEYDLVQVAIKHHGIMSHLADHYCHIKYFIISVHHMQHEFRKVNDDKIATWFLWHPVHPVHVQ